MAQLERKLRAAQGKDRSRDTVCLVTCIGHRVTTRSGHSFENPACPTLIVHALGVGYTAPTKDQEEACRALWLTSSTASAAYKFPSTRMPVLADGCHSFTPSPAPAGEVQETD
jgi:hypothetical protein